MKKYLFLLCVVLAVAACDKKTAPPATDQGAAPATAAPAAPAPTDMMGGQPPAMGGQPPAMGGQPPDMGGQPGGAAPGGAGSMPPAAPPAGGSGSDAGDVAPAKSGVAQSNPAQTSALVLAQKSGCLTCHQIDKKLVGPAYMDVSKRYVGNPNARAQLIEKVKKGGKGNWTEVTGGAAMPPYSPRVADNDIATLTDFILALK